MESEIIANSKVEPRWLPGWNRFCYRVGLPDKYQSALAQCTEATRTAGLDEDGLAAEVERVTGQKLDLDTLTTDGKEQSLPRDNSNLKGTFADEQAPSPYVSIEASVQFFNNCSTL